MTNQEIREAYEKACNEYVKKFAQKQGIEFEFWVSDRVGETACFSSHHAFNMPELIYDIDSNQPKGLIMEWHEKSLENQGEKWINYFSYCLGFRYS